MHHSPIERIVLVSLSGIFLAILALAFHHHDHTFLLRSSSLCKVKTSSSGTRGKGKIDSPPAVAVVPLGMAVAFPLSITGAPEERALFIASQSAAVWPNKAPPVGA